MMKQISTRLLTVLGLCMFLFSACNNSSDFTVKGVVAGADGQLMYLENVGISNVVTLDSIKLAPAGSSSLRRSVLSIRTFIVCV